MVDSLSAVLVAALGKGAISAPSVGDIGKCLNDVRLKKIF